MILEMCTFTLTFEMVKTELTILCLRRQKDILWSTDSFISDFSRLKKKKPKNCPKGFKIERTHSGGISGTKNGCRRNRGGR